MKGLQWYTSAFIIFAILISSILIPHNSYAQISVSGNQSGIWEAGSSFLVVGSVTVPSGDTLTIEPGVIVNVEQPSFSITVQGVLNASGTAADSIRFTSNDTTKAGGQWRGLEIRGGQGNFEYCVIEAAGDFSQFPGFTFAGLKTTGSSTLTISKSTIRKILNTHDTRTSYGLWVTGNSTATVTDLLVEDVQDDGIRIEFQSAATVTGTEVRNAGGDGLEINTNSVSVAISSITGNIFSNNGAYGARLISATKSPIFSDNTISGNGSGGLGVSGTFDQSIIWDVDTDLLKSTTINGGFTLTIPPGVVVEGIGLNTFLRIQGTLEAVGTETDSIVFTSDDAIKAGGQWRGIDIRRGIATMEYCLIEAAGDFSEFPGFTYAGLQAASGATLTISKSTIRKILNTHDTRTSYGLWVTGNSTATVTDLLVEDVQDDGIRIEFQSAATVTGTEVRNAGGDGLEINTNSVSVAISSITGNIFSNNGAYGARLISATKSPIFSDNTISGNGSGGLGVSGTFDQSIIWDVDTDLLKSTTINGGFTLTIPPGVVVEGIGLNTFLRIQGTLEAVGTEADSIVFTSDMITKMVDSGKASESKAAARAILNIALSRPPVIIPMAPQKQGGVFVQTCLQ